MHACMLCTACVHRDRCDLDDPFAGNDGVIDCLRMEAGDIAFMDHFNAQRAQADPSTRDDFRLLCTDGCHPIGEDLRVRPLQPLPHCSTCQAASVRSMLWLASFCTQTGIHLVAQLGG